ncbi:hypothetical protein GCM10022276_12510 [Sphingomonas limnosediminicola]|uniref:DUF1707 domain-containing protein n=1 Tax=Sphingomonas limnosediminicola TaxID=940133 RepID=A0ABP7L813_9SPHN
MESDRKDEGRIAAGSRPANAAEFIESLDRRRQAQDRLEQDLLHDVPLLYGSPGEVGFHDPRDGPGDPGIIIARIHREEMLRGNGVDTFGASGDRSDVRLPFERTLIWLVFLLCAIELLAKFA